MEKLAAVLSTEVKQRISGNDVYYALFMLYGDRLEMEWVMDVLDREMDFDLLLEQLSTFDFALLLAARILFPDAELIEDNWTYQCECQYQIYGVVWTIDEHDAVHLGHSHMRTRLMKIFKLDLSNGRCYRVRQYLKPFQEDLIEIRNKAAKKFKGELPVLAV